MNRIKITLLLLFTLSNVMAQKFGHFSSEYIVEQMPGYQQARQELEMLTQAWMAEIKDRYIEIGRLENELEAEKILLTSRMINEREKEIESRLKEAVDYQYKLFGPEGLLFLKKQELVKPELDKVFEAVERVCKKQRLDYLMDKSAALVMVYTNPVHDYTDFVLEELGLGDPRDNIR